VFAQGFYPCYSKDMSKVTSKLQLTVPKTIADQYGIRPGDELQWAPAGESIRVSLARGRTKAEHPLTLRERLELFDQGSKRLCKIQREQLKKAVRSKAGRQNRGWTREELYDRGFPR
jgi:bifunctional DNA-binding transcriptional regulator/antitoxin component of YhaV-PrlF toxin-antitoxin module